MVCRTSTKVSNRAHPITHQAMHQAMQQSIKPPQSFGSNSPSCSPVDEPHCSACCSSTSRDAASASAAFRTTTKGLDHSSTSEREEILRSLAHLLELAFDLAARVLPACRPASTTFGRAQGSDGAGEFLQDGHAVCSSFRDRPSRHVLAHVCFELVLLQRLIELEEVAG